MSDDDADIAELLDRVKALSGRDKHVGREVLLACGRGFVSPLYAWLDPTASIDAAMQLIPTDGSVTLIDLELGWEANEAGVYPAASVRWYPPHHTGKDWHALVASAATIPLTVTAAALEMRHRMPTSSPITQPGHRHDR